MAGFKVKNRTKGILAITVSAFGFALMALFVRLCDDYGAPVSSFQKSFFRNVVALSIAAAAWWRAQEAGRSGLAGESGGAGLARAKPWALLVLRAVLGTGGIFANFYALSYIDIAEGQVCIASRGKMKKLCLEAGFECKQR